MPLGGTFCSLVQMLGRLLDCVEIQKSAKDLEQIHPSNVMTTCETTILQRLQNGITILIQGFV